VLKKFNLIVALVFLSGCSALSSATSVQVTSPASGSTVSSPVTINAKADPGPRIARWQVYVDNVSVYSTGASSTISPSISMSAGTHNIIVQAWSNNGNSASANLTLTVSSTPNPSVSVSISPSSTALQTGASAQFTASVSGTSNTSVTWLVNGIQGGNSTVGTITSSGLYTAPAAVPSGSSVTVTATSVADTTKSASASVSILAPPTPVSVSISPTSATVQAGQSTQFAASVTGTTNSGINWQVAGITGGNSTVGLISSTGLYTAPLSVPATNPVTVTARSAYDSTASANATVTVTSGPGLYVSTTGNDANNCTSSAPCQTLNRADSLVTPGTTVHVAPGTYTGPFLVGHSGTSTARITFVSDVKWGAKLVAPSAAPDGWILRSNGSYVDIVGFEITNSEATGILINGSHTRAIGNHIHHLDPTSCPGGSGIFSWGNYQITDIDYIGNVLHDIGNVDSANPCSFTQGLYIGNSGGKVLNNIVYRISGFGIQMWHAASNMVIANNTSFANMQSGLVVGGGDSGLTTGANNTAVFNNIFVNNRNYGMTQQGTYGPSNTFKNNLIYGNGLGAVYQLTDSGRITANPAFVNYNPTGTGDYHLQSGSPAIDAGVSSATAGITNGVAPIDDFDGNSRPMGAAWDIGAYEWGSTGPTLIW
jgi:Right handed beta helix region/Protein of unknown function (DUF1565)